MRAAFSLIELSIVLVILGLLTGGILSGQSLIRASETRSILADISRYRAAAFSFRDKYFHIPGDMTNATRFWGDNNGQCADAAIANGTPGTCNGDGNGQVGIASAASTTGENFQFWVQLAYAGLIEGTYTGISGTGGLNHATSGVNMPASRISMAGYYVAYRGNGPEDANAFTLPYFSNLIQFGLNSAVAPPNIAALRPEEAWNLDSKADDGKPAMGAMLARTWNGNCTTATSSTDTTAAEYKLDQNGLACSFYYKLGL